MASYEIDYALYFLLTVALHSHFICGSADSFVSQYAFNHFNQLGGGDIQDISALPDIVRHDTGCVPELIGPCREDQHG